jgi:glycosyltransferase involved in cell wall biosynthesis
MTAITVYAPGHWDMFDSYGLIACQLARHLTALDVHVNAVGVGNTVMGNQPPDVRAVTERPIKPSLGGVVMGYPTSYGRHSALLHAGPRIAITMFESSRCPASWIEPLNDMDAIITPSWFCANVFRDCGVTVPIHVVPLGVGDVYRYAERPRERPLTFLAFMDRGARKGGIVALQAFLMAFGESMDYRLILKSRKAKIPLEFTNPNITAIHQDMSEAELYQLYLSADVLINPHRGEGFGLLPREFACTGGIAMTTKWSGTADGIGVWGYPLPYELVKADWKGNKYLEGQDLGSWAQVSPERVATHLRIVAGNREYYQEQAKSAAYHTAKLYSWRQFAEQVLSIWEGVRSGYASRATAA